VRATAASSAITYNRGSGKPGYIGVWDVDCLGLLIAWNQCSNWIGAAIFERNRLADRAFVANNLRGALNRKKPPKQLAKMPASYPWALLDAPRHCDTVLWQSMLMIRYRHQPAHQPCDAQDRCRCRKHAGLAKTGRSLAARPTAPAATGKRGTSRTALPRP